MSTPTTPGASVASGRELLGRKVSLYDHTKDVVGRPVAFVEIIDGILGGKWKASVDQVRAETDEDRQKEIKKTLPGFTAAGVFKRRNKTSIELPAGLVVIDIDGLGGYEKAVEVRDTLAEDPHVLAGFVSVRGEGVKLIVYAGEIATDSEFKAAWRAFAEYAADNYGLSLDPSGKDICRLCFVSNDRGVFVNTGEVVPFTARAEIEKELPQCHCDTSGNEEAAPTEAPRPAAEESVSDAPPIQNVRAALCHLDPGVEYDKWLRIAMAVKSVYPGKEGFALFDEWSKRAPARYGGTAEAWKSIKAGGGVTVGTLYAAAEGAGWVNPQGKLYAELRRAKAEAAEPGADDEDAGNPFVPFPVECLPGKVEDYVRNVAVANCVDPCAPALAVLVVAGAAMGNAFRLKLKNRFTVPPLLWGCVVARTGMNKSAPMNEVVEPLRETRPEVHHEDPDQARMALLCPQSRGVIGDATSAAVIHRLAAAPRGLCMFRDELAAWVREFDAYKKGAGGGGGDEQFWLKSWDAHHYQLDRKTDLEHKEIHAAAVSVLGGMQPAVLASCFDPGKFASGLVPRLLAVYPPEQSMRWTEVEISEEARAGWKQIVGALRFRPFESFGATGASYTANVVELSPGAKESYVAFFDELSTEMEAMDEFKRGFASKARVMVARLALILHGLETVTARGDWSAPVSRPTMDAAVTMGRWFLNEQFRAYGFASIRHDRKRAEDVAAWVRSRGGRTTARDLQRAHNKRYSSAESAKLDLERLVKAGRGSWEGSVFVLGG